MAKQRLVTCVECGRQFDVNRGGYYNKQSKRYICKSCGKRLKKEERSAKADLRETTTGMRQSIPAMIAKIAFGVLFVFSGFSQGEIGTIITGIAIGLALIAWGALPAYMAYKKSQSNPDDPAS